MDDRTRNPGVWTAASCPPETKPGSWSREVIGFTNMGNVFKVRYYNGKGEGIGDWGWSLFFMTGETIKWWIDKPDNE